jgi:hypothetical protein
MLLKLPSIRSGRCRRAEPGIARLAWKAESRRRSFDWYDAYPDGRVHISEMANSIWANDGNPIAVFDVGGALTFQMFAFLEISILF